MAENKRYKKKYKKTLNPNKSREMYYKGKAVIQNPEVHKEILNHYKFLVKTHLKENVMSKAYQGMKLDRYFLQFREIKLDPNAIKMTNKDLEKAIQFADKNVMNDISSKIDISQKVTFKDIIVAIKKSQDIHSLNLLKNIDGMLPKRKDLTDILGSNHISSTKVIEHFDKDFNTNALHAFKSFSEIKSTHTFVQGVLTLKEKPLSNQLSNQQKILKDTSQELKSQKKKMGTVVLDAKKSVNQSKIKTNKSKEQYRSK